MRFIVAFLGGGVIGTVAARKNLHPITWILMCVAWSTVVTVVFNILEGA